MKRVLITNPRSGTHYLKALISTALGEPPVEKEFVTADELHAVLSSASDSQLIYGHFHYSAFGSILDTTKLPDLRLVVLTRHPFDRLISQLARTRALRGRIPDSTRTPQQLARELMLGEWDSRPWEDGHIIMDYAAVHNLYLRELVTDWLKFRRCLLVKFEDLISEPLVLMTACLDFLEVPACPDYVRSVVETVNFATLSSGRRVGQVDLESHYRKGVSGEWRHVFTKGDLELLRPKFGIAFRQSGYDL